jgi:putative RNA ligase
MSTLDLLFPPGALAQAIADGHVRAQAHPTASLTIYNYTEHCAFASAWTEVTLACRGLIVDALGGIVARPFAKFFNAGQPGAPTIGLDEPVSVTDKADGSLGIIYDGPDGLAVATRGSFASAQALHATSLLRRRYRDWAPPAGLTVLVEIIYPANRIVLDYGGMDDLVLLGAVEIATGRTFGPDAIPDWPGPVVEVFDYPTFGVALAAPPRPSREGLVVHVRSTGNRLKIKYEEYVHLHRLITGLSARTVWEALASGATVEQVAAPLPDEFHGWVRQIAARLHTGIADLEHEIEATFQEIIGNLEDGWSRKDFALVAARHALRGYLFARLDGKPYREALWQHVKPPADETPHGLFGQD